MVYLVKDLLHLKFTYCTSWNPKAVYLKESQPKKHILMSQAEHSSRRLHLMFGSSNQMVKAMIFTDFLDNDAIFFSHESGSYISMHQ